MSSWAMLAMTNLQVTSRHRLCAQKNIHNYNCRIKRERFCSTCALEKAIRYYIAQNNAEPKLFVRTKTANEILTSLADFYQRVLCHGRCHSVYIGTRYAPRAACEPNLYFHGERPTRCILLSMSAAKP
jgi:hypothetical protein